eukprot:TRINITY_DN2107_c0_g2_i1.p1 TRINITY_DN2107_c0_g2~~TRINITY_DN2107_c0_g2_i1.p1  ORF type:complete len:667 (+),score=117.54 TRINITY_DN2107_c0_g2_i1:52-2052(+)
MKSSNSERTIRLSHLSTPISHLLRPSPLATTDLKQMEQLTPSDKLDLKKRDSQRSPKLEINVSCATAPNLHTASSVKNQSSATEVMSPSPRPLEMPNQNEEISSTMNLSRLPSTMITPKGILLPSPTMKDVGINPGELTVSSKAFIEAMKALQERIKSLENDLALNMAENERTQHALRIEKQALAEQLQDQMEQASRTEYTLKNKIRVLENENAELNKFIGSLHEDMDNHRDLAVQFEKAQQKVLREEISVLRATNEVHQLEKEKLLKRIRHLEDLPSTRTRTERTGNGDQADDQLSKEELQKLIQKMRNDFLLQVDDFKREVGDLEVVFKKETDQLRAELETAKRRNNECEELLQARQTRIDALERKNKKFRDTFNQVRRMKEEDIYHSDSKGFQRVQSQQVLPKPSTPLHKVHESSDVDSRREKISSISGAGRRLLQQRDRGDVEISNQSSISMVVTYNEQQTADHIQSDLAKIVKSGNKTPIATDTQSLRQKAIERSYMKNTQIPKFRLKDRERTPSPKRKNLSSVTVNTGKEYHTPKIGNYLTPQTSLQRISLGSPVEKIKSVIQKLRQTQESEKESPRKGLCEDLEGKIQDLHRTFRSLAAQFQSCEEADKRAAIRTRMMETTLQIQRLAANGSSLRRKESAYQEKELLEAYLPSNKGWNV